MKILSNYIWFFCLLLAISCKNEPLATSVVKTERIPVNSSVKAKNSITEYIEPYKQQLNLTLDSTLAYNPELLSKNDGDLNTALGNLMADAVMEQANPIFKSREGKNIDFVLLNHGGIRAEIPKGNITSRTAYQLMPFENEIVIVELSAKKLKEMLAYLEDAKTAHPIGGIKIKADKNYRITEAEINGEPINEERTYFVATSDYLQQGGDNMKFFANPLNLYSTNYKIRNALIDYFKKVDTIKTEIDNRYTRKK